MTLAHYSKFLPRLGQTVTINNQVGKVVSYTTQTVNVLGAQDQMFVLHWSQKKRGWQLPGGSVAVFA